MAVPTKKKKKKITELSFREISLQHASYLIFEQHPDILSKLVPTVHV